MKLVLNVLAFLGTAFPLVLVAILILAGLGVLREDEPYLATLSLMLLCYLGLGCVSIPIQRLLYRKCPPELRALSRGWMLGRPKPCYGLADCCMAVFMFVPALLTFAAEP